MSKVNKKIVKKDWMSSTQHTLCTAFTHDYVVGYLCAEVNEAYAAAHGYRWVCETMSPDAMAYKL